MAIPLLAVAELFKRNYEAILLVGIAVVVTLLIASLWVDKARMETKYNKEVAAHAKTKKAYAEERTRAANLAAEYERLEREKEHLKATMLAEQRDRDAKRDADWNDRVRNLNASKRELLNHITRLTNYTRPSEASPESTAAVGDLPERLAACGSLLEASTGIGRACAADYGTARNRLDTCTRYVEVINK